MPVFLRQARESVLNVLQAHLVQVVADSDDALCDLSIGANSNSEQTLYFESMKEVRSKKDIVLHDYQQLIFQRFEDLLADEHHLPPPDTANPESLSLVEDDDVEQDIAMSTMIGKARANNQEALYHLKCRFDKLLPGVVITDRNNPLDPATLCKAFKAATAELDMDIKARIILFKHFDREVIGNLPGIYDSTNELLIKSGVLPNIKSTIKKQASKPLPPTAPSASNETALVNDIGESTAPAHNLQDLSTLLGGLHRLNIQPASFIPRYSTRTGPLVTQDDLVRLLAELQASISCEELLHQQALDIRSAIESIMSTMDAAGAPNHALTTPDEDVINLVAMFFDFVLSDHSLPMSFQAMIARLQLPILKLALRDTDFFNTNRHPARMLINEIARLGVGFEDNNSGTQGLIVKTIEEIIKEIHDVPEADTDLFEAMRCKLQQVVNKEEYKAGLVEKRAQEMASGQAKTQAARAKVQLVLRQRLKDTELPESISKFLVEDWQNVLLLTKLKHGEDSAEWLEALQLVDDLIWSVHVHQDDKSKVRRAKLLPALRKRIRKGLKTMVASEADMEAIVAVIDQIHDSLMQGRIEDIHYNTLRSEQEATLKQAGEEKDWKEMTAVERQRARHKRTAYDFIRKADALQTGTWMVFNDQTTGKSLRCKLSAKLEETDTYVFVNRFGFKTLDKKRTEVALELQHKRAAVIDSRPLFDRAFNKIAESLKDSGRVAAS
jgi:hypothetical protein